jgi:hypothetical protein
MNRRTFSTTALAAVAGLGSALSGRPVSAQAASDVPPLEPWRLRRKVAHGLTGPVDHAKLVRQIWDGYGLAAPNYYDSVEVFCGAILADWQRQRSAYVLRYASATSGNQVYVLPQRFLLSHPAFLPDFPNGYYWIDPACEPGEAPSCVHPGAFFRILPAESIDEYRPGETTPAPSA